VTARPLDQILQASNSARRPVSETRARWWLDPPFIVHTIGGTEEGSAHHGEREGAVDVEGIPGSRGAPVLRVHGVGVFAQQHRLPRRPRQLRDGEVRLFPSTGSSSAAAPGRRRQDGRHGADGQDSSAPRVAARPPPPHSCASFLLPLLPPFSGGGEFGGKNSPWAADQGEGGGLAL
jgi:hypothetical protein